MSEKVFQLIKGGFLPKVIEYANKLVCRLFVFALNNYYLFFQFCWRNEEITKSIGNINVGVDEEFNVNQSEGLHCIGDEFNHL